MHIDKCELINKLEKYKQHKNYFFEDIKFKFYNIITSILMFTSWFLLYLFKIDFKIFFLILFTISTSFLLSIECYIKYRKNKKKIIIARELNLTMFQLNYCLKKYKLHEKL